ncbi:hypothetical protein, partial [Holdemania filiformis]|uniref:hypothetical protein n=1 Tax=Holdemania filiformis TaxID=61171 RepID=UPI0024306A63
VFRRKPSRLPKQARKFKSDAARRGMMYVSVFLSDAPIQKLLSAGKAVFFLFPPDFHSDHPFGFVHRIQELGNYHGAIHGNLPAVSAADRKRH